MGDNIKNLPETFQQQEDHLDSYQDELVLPTDLRFSHPSTEKTNHKKQLNLDVVSLANLFLGS